MSLQRHTGAVEFKEFSLRLSEASHVHDAVSDDSHFLQRVLVRHRRNKQFAAVLKGNEPAIKKVTNRRRDQQTTALEQPLAVVGFPPRFDMTRDQMLQLVHTRDTTEAFQSPDSLTEPTLAPASFNECVDAGDHLNVAWKTQMTTLSGTLAC